MTGRNEEITYQRCNLSKIRAMNLVLSYQEPSNNMALHSISPPLSLVVSVLSEYEKKEVLIKLPARTAAFAFNLSYTNKYSAR